MSVILFEDQRVEQLAPVTLCRPAHAISCGGATLVDVIRSMGESVSALVRAHLQAVEQQDRSDIGALSHSAEPLLVLSSRVVPDRTVLTQISQLLRCGETGKFEAAGQLVGVIVASAEKFCSGLTLDNCGDRMAAAATELKALPVNVSALEYTHDIIRHHQMIFADNLKQQIDGGNYREVADDVFAAPGATLGDYIVSDGTKGPIVLAEDCTVGPFSVLTGPLLIGPKTTVNPRTTLKPNVATGYRVKLGGEIGTSIIADYSNKQHHGYLGHSFVGSWVNLGAGTSNSNLKNTYGTVRVEVAGQKIDTGMDMLGCVIGDFTKAAINTSIFTGKRIGCCSMLYGYVAEDVGSFVNYARSFGDMTAVSVDAVLTMLSRTFPRRDRKPRPCDEQLVRDVFAMTAGDREELASRPPRF